MRNLIVSFFFLATLTATLTASADPARSTSVPRTEETAERPGSDRFDELTSVVSERSCVGGSPTVLGNIVVDCVRPTARADRQGRHHSHRHAARTRHHRSHRHAQPVDQTVLAQTLLAQTATVGEHTPEWMQLGQIRARLQGMNATDPRVDNLLIEARAILVGLGYNPPPVITASASAEMTADAVPTFSR